jgi:glycosyltransferase involved in cell wall biosynthesis
VRNIAFVTPGYDPRDVRRGSGTYYHLAKELERQGCRLHCAGPLIVQDPLPTRFFRMLNRRMSKGRYLSYLDPWIAKARCKTLAKQLAEVQHDVLLTNDYGIAAYIQTNKPIILYTDAIFPYDYENNIHPWLENLPPTTIFFSQLVTRRGLARADLCVFPSNWTADQAVAYGKSISQKCRVIPFGANIEDIGAEVASSRDFSKTQKKNEIHLLFIGTDWECKGGAIAVTVTKELRKQGVAASLHIVGKAPSQVTEQEHIYFYGYLDKTNPADVAKLYSLYRLCDVFIMPSKAEGFGIVFAEAAAFGLPALAFNTTGVTGAIQNGRTGILLSLDCRNPSEKFVAEIQNWFQNPGCYNSLTQNARLYYANTLNWKVATSKLITEIEITLGMIEKRLKH